jgi:hypothetical protein
MAFFRNRRTVRSVGLRRGNFKISKIGATHFDLREPYYIAIASSWPMFLLLALAVLAFAVSSFAMLYLAQSGAIKGIEDGE